LQREWEAEKGGIVAESPTKSGDRSALHKPCGLKAMSSDLNLYHLQPDPNMSNQPQKKKSRFLLPSSIWKSLRSRSPSPSNAAQSASVSPAGAPSDALTSSPPYPTGHNTGIQSVTPPVPAAQAGSSTPDHPSSYPGRSPQSLCVSALTLA